MKNSFYIKLAWTNLKKNYRLYIPNILAGIGLLSVFYIMLTITADEKLHQIRGGSYMPTIMVMGMIIIIILSTIFLLYTNSFLIRQRTREFGLYNVLGMNKKHIGVILFYELFLSLLFVLSGGLLFGIVFYKFCTLLICKIMQVQTILGFDYIRFSTIIPSAVFFILLYFINYIIDCIRITRLKPVDLLHNSQMGEKEPRIKWILLIIGLITLGSGYCISITTVQPLQALNKFFGAVLLVIVGTYCLFITGTISLLKGLKNNKKYYYQKNHMTTISGLLYRMKQNSVGLASIAVMATIVLVMVSTTLCMYIGIENSIKTGYPHQAKASASYVLEDDIINIPDDDWAEIVKNTAENQGLEITYLNLHHSFYAAFLYENDEFITDRSRTDYNGMDIIECWFMTAEEYGKLTGTELKLSANEMALYSNSVNSGHMGSYFNLGEDTYQITAKLETYPISFTEHQMVDCYGFVVSDEETFMRLYKIQAEAYKANAGILENTIQMDFTETLTQENYLVFINAVKKSCEEYAEAHGSNELLFYADDLWSGTEYSYGWVGSLLFLGLILSFIFIFAAALIIYYKQISEGYEDRERFQILQKIGMSSAEVKSTIKNQILIVFFLPLLTAAIHLAFAFPMLSRMLRILFVCEQKLFIICTIAALGLFAVIYLLIYTVTARTYYHIIR